jgi:hypothetical protein
VAEALRHYERFRALRPTAGPPSRIRLPSPRPTS